MDTISHERDENKERLDFTTSEAVAIGKAIEEREKPKAAERQSAGRKSGGRGKKKLASNLDASNSGAASQSDGESKRTDEKAAAAVGMSKDTYRKAKAVVEAAEAEPEKFGQLVEQMDKTGKVNAVPTRGSRQLYRGGYS